MFVINKKFLVSTVFVVISIVTLSGCGSQKVIQQKEEQKSVDIKQWQTKNGVKVLYVYAPELPLLDVNVVFDAGSVRDNNKPGIATMTNGLLSHGSKLGNKILTVDDISERFEDIGARFSASATKDYAALKLRTLTDKKWLSQAITTLQSIINAPVFERKEFKRTQKQMLIGIEGRKQSPGTIANEIFYKNLYGEHPYANPSVGTIASIKKMTRHDLMGFYKKYYVAKNALVTIVGNVDKQKARQLAEQLTGNLPAGKKAAVLSAVKDIPAASSIHKEFPSSQTHIMMGQPGVHRKDKDYFTLYVANHILGGSGFGSRIMEEIREKRGLAYSSYSYFIPMLKRGPFIIGMQTSNKQTDEAMVVLKDTLVNFINEGPSEKELLHSKKNITGGFPLRIDSNKDISNYLTVIGFYNLPLDYLKIFNQRINAVTLAQIKDALKRRIDPDKMLAVTVGTSVN